MIAHKHALMFNNCNRSCMSDLLITNDNVNAVCVCVYL